MQILPVGAELVHANRRTDVTKLIVIFFAILRTRLKSKFEKKTIPSPHLNMRILGSVN